MTLQDILNKTDEHLSLLDFEILMQENGEYGSFSILPAVGARIDYEKKTIIIED